jgi:uncharacterized protein (TIGR03435 family)
MKTTSVALAVLLLSILIVASTTAQTKATARLEFDAASIKLSPPPDGPVRVSMPGDHGRINYTNVTMRALIRKAYGLRIYPPSPGASDPLSTERYDIIAKAPGDASNEQTMQMLQSLLEDRFKLAVHKETKELPVYALIVNKGGPKFREVKDDGSAAEIGGRSGYQITGHHVSMKALAGALQGYVADPVVEMTGLTGIFDINLEFSADESLAPNATSGPSIFTAVQEQLGLKLEARKGPVEVVVIDHVEKPSEN